MASALESEDQLVQLAWRNIQRSDDYLSEEVRPSRAQALRYYNGENPDNLPQVEGRSRMVDPVVRDTIEWIKPSLLRIFSSGDKVVQIDGYGEEDIEKAKLADAWVNFVMTKVNNGYVNDMQWFHDALLERDGWEKIYWYKDHVVKYRQELGDAADLKAARKNEHVDEDSVVEVEDGVYSYNVRYSEEEWNIREEVVPPEEVLYPPENKVDRRSWSFICHRSRKTLSEIRQMGLKIEDDQPGPEIDKTTTYEDAMERFAGDRTSYWQGADDDGQDYIDLDPSLRKVWIYECYQKTDLDGDGIAEWIKFHLVGNTILEDENGDQWEEVDEPHLYHITPIIRSHRLNGISIHDLVSDVQELMTALNRQILDNLYLSNTPRAEINIRTASEFTLSDYLDQRIGGYVRVKEAGTITPIQHTPMQPWTMQVVEYWEGKRETRAGVTRYNQGLDANSLNKTASGMMQIFQASMQRIEMIARTFAETGVRDKVLGILRLSAKYPDLVSERNIRLQGKQWNIRPEDLQGRFDLAINPAIGLGNKEQMLQHLMTLLQTYAQMAAAGLGPGSEKALFATDQLFNTMREMLKNMGFRNYSEFVIDPADETAKRDPVAQPQPSPDMVKAQGDMQKAQAEVQLKQGELQLEQQKLQHDMQMSEERLKLDAQRIKLEAKRLELEAIKAAHERDTAAAERSMVAPPAEDKEEVMFRREKELRELAIKEREAAAKMEKLNAEIAKSMAELAETEEALAQLREMRGDVDKLAGPISVERDASGMIVSVNGRPVIRNEAGLLQGLGGLPEEREEDMEEMPSVERLQ